MIFVDRYITSIANHFFNNVGGVLQNLRILICRLARKQCVTLYRLRASIVADRERRAFVHRDAGVFAFRVQDVEVDAEVWISSAVKK